MMYPYTSIDGVEISHSELLDNGRVVVLCEKAGATARFELPDCTCITAEGFETRYLQSLTGFVRDCERDIFRWAAEGTRELAQKQREG